MNPLVRANYLASPPLVVAYALAGRVDIDLTNEPLGQGSRRQGCVPARHLADRREKCRRLVKKSVQREMFAKQYSRGLRGRRAVERDQGSPGRSLRVGRYVHLHQTRAVLRRHGGSHDVREGSSGPAVPGGAGRFDHHRSYFSGRQYREGFSPAGKYLISLGVKPGDFNSYGARRGNHEVMVRGTLANIRLRNQMAPGTEGGWTTHVPSGEKMFIYDASVKYRADGYAAADHRRQGIRQRIVARLGGEGRAAAGRARGDRGELRAHSSLEPGGHGRAAAAVRGRAESRVAGLDRVRIVLDRRDSGGGRFVREDSRAGHSRTARRSRQWRGSIRRWKRNTIATAGFCRTCCGSWPSNACGATCQVATTA